MDDAKPSALKKAGSIGLITGGTFTLIDSMKILENGVVTFDSFLHTEISDGGRAGVAAMQRSGPDGFVCNSDWRIDGFGPGWSAHLGDPNMAIGTPEPSGVDTDLSNEISRVANSIAHSYQEGALVVIGSTDPTTYRKSPKYNSDLARDRGQEVVDGFNQIFNGSSGTTPRKVYLGNDIISGKANPDITSNPAVSKGIARILLGPKEDSGRAVVTCVIETSARPADVVATGTGPGVATTFLAGFGIGLIAIIGVALGTWLAVRTAAQAIRKAWEARNERPGDGGG